MIGIRHAALVAALVVASHGGTAVAQPMTPRTSGEVIRRWNEIATAQESGNPLRLGRILAIMHAAQHDAVNSVEARYAPYAALFADPMSNAEAAAASAAHTVLLAFFPDNAAALDAELEALPEDSSVAAGVALGRRVGQHVLEIRANDGFELEDPYAPMVEPGLWHPTPPAYAPMLEPQFQNVRPFALEHRSQFLPQPPPALPSAEYAANYDEVKRLGQDRSEARTVDETHLGHFWAEPSPAGWSRIGSIVSDVYGYDLHDTARLMAVLNMAMADGFVVGWYQKRYFGFWRPITAIRAADRDANPATAADPEWLSLRPTPPLPDYPSTHSLLGSAAAEVLRQFTGSDAFEFCMGSTSARPTGTQRCWSSFSQAEQENARSRVVIGFHFTFACEAGMQVGREVGRFTIERALQPV